MSITPRSGEGPALSFGVLGPLTVARAGHPVEVKTVMLRRLLAVLLSRAGRPVPLDVLADVVWCGEPPATARKTLLVYVHRLRRLIGPDHIRLEPAGYVLDGDVDAAIFAGLVRRMRASDHLRDVKGYGEQALGLWRGRAYGEFSDVLPLAQEADRLEQLRMAAFEDLAEARLRLGEHHEVVAELAAAVHDHPFRERMREHLVLALYRVGRLTDAMQAFHDARATLADQLGVEPSSALLQLHQRILRRDPTLDWVAPAPRGPRLLPPAVAGFLGRRTDLEWLDRAAAGQAAVIAISGIGGVGKTALAVHWTRRIAANYPDGQLYVSLRGFDPRGPMPTQTAVGTLLKALGLPPERVPADLDDAAALYRSTTAGLRLLVVLDDARSTEHVRPLIPTGTGSLAVVTSRDTLTGLVVREGAPLLLLRPLPADDATAILDHVLGATRVGREGAAVTELAALCGNLPLALRIAAASLLADPRRSIQDMVDALRRSDRLASLAVADEAIQAVFDQSYAALSAADQHVFRLLGLHVGLDITVEAAGALASSTPADARATLARLADANLVDEVTEGRYQMHDLLKVYAAGQDEPDRVEATARLLDFYLNAAASAASVVAPQTMVLTSPSRRHPEHVDTATAMAWLQAEHHNLVAAVAHAADHGPVSAAWRLADVLRGYFWVRRELGDWLATAQAGMTAAIADGSLSGQAAMHLSLGTARRSCGELDDAIDHLDAARRMSRDAGWIDGEAAALGGLGIIDSDRGDKSSAIAHLTHAAELNRRGRRTAALAVNLSNIGSIRLTAGELRQAAHDLAQALELFRITGNRVTEAIISSNLGLLHIDLGHYDVAEKLLTQALALQEQVADRAGTTATTLALAEMNLRLGRLDDTARLAQQAIDIADTIDSPRHRAVGLIALAHVHLRRGRPTEALALATEAVTIAREISMRYIENDALEALAQIKNNQGRHREAHEDALEALAIAETDGYQSMVVKSLTTLAEIHQATDRPQAVAYAQRALLICETTGIQQCVRRLETVLASTAKVVARRHP